MLQPAVASHDVDVDTIGIGDARNTAEDAPASSADRMRATSADTASVSSSATRSITVSDPDPVIVISAYDATNASTAAAAMELGTTDPLPTAPHIMPDESDGWTLGSASAYSHADNDDGKGNFGTDVTASGVPLSSEGLTVAVPESQAHLWAMPWPFVMARLSLWPRSPIPAASSRTAARSTLLPAVGRRSE